jgi:dihydroorotate dehydrogenase (NAD+) catalytic subunit
MAPKTRPDLGVKLAGMTLRSPTIMASGILGTCTALLKRAAENGAGAATIKSVSWEPRDGHANPTVLTFEAGMINAVGYSNPGVLAARDQFSDIGAVGIPVIASVIGKEADDFARVFEALARVPFAAVELPLSCPHTPGYGLLAGQGTPEATAAITAAMRKITKLPIFVKVSPNIANLGNVCKAAEDAGADAITAVNSLGPGMLINIEARRPVLAFGVGGVTGPALRPIATRCVFDIYKAVKIPIIGVGGVSTGRHAIEMIMAGATAVGIGSAVYYEGIEVFRKVCDEMAEWMAENGVESLADIVGAAHG